MTTCPRCDSDHVESTCLGVIRMPGMSEAEHKQATHDANRHRCLRCRHRWGPKEDR